MLNNQVKFLHKNKIIVLSLIILAFAFAGCGDKEPEYIPGQGIQGIREPMFRILLSPVAYDGAIVVIEGVVRDYSEQQGTTFTDSDEIETTFKLYDTKGNYINIVMPGSWELADNDYLIVGGMYRQNINEIEAKQFEKVQFKELEDSEIEKEIEKRDDW